MAIGEHILDLSVVSHLFTGEQLKANRHVFLEVCFGECKHLTSYSLMKVRRTLHLLAFVLLDSQDSLNEFMALGSKAWKEARAHIQDMLDQNSPLIQDDESLSKK